MRYRKKPVEIEAVQWTGLNLEEIKAFVGKSLIYDIIDTAWEVGKGRPRVFMKIKTLEGDMIVSEGDYIIKGISGEFYPCKPDIFKATYDQSSRADLAIEEMAELQKALLKYRRADRPELQALRMKDIAEEIADVQIMLDQLIEVYNCRDDVERMIGYKIERQLKRIERKEMIGKVLYE